MKTAIKHEVINVTPDNAKKWLAAVNGLNFRRPHEPMVESYAQDMRMGKWTLNGESVKFDSRGTLVDGQHRLLACVKANKPFTTLAVWNCDQTEEVDSGFKRTYAQLLSHQNVKNAAAVASSIRLMAFLEDVSRLGGADASAIFSRRRSPASLKVVYQKFPGIESFCAKANELRKLFSSSYAAAIMCWSCDSEWLEPCETFVVGLRDPSHLDDNNPIFALGRRLRNLGPHQELTRTALMAITIISWNHHIAGKGLSVLRWFKTDKFPVPDKVAR